MVDVSELATTVRVGHLDHLVMTDLRPREARVALLREIIGILQRVGVRCIAVAGASHPGSTIAVLAEDRSRALDALDAALARPGVHFQEMYSGAPESSPAALISTPLSTAPSRCIRLRIATLWTHAGRTLTYGMNYGVVVEFWENVADEPNHVLTPRGPSGQVIDIDLLSAGSIEVDGDMWPSAGVFEAPEPSDVRFPVDAVYTWVDGSDEAWLTRFEAARAAAEGREFHPEAVSANRFADHEELKYSLRSLDMYAPWIRHIYLVTDGQVPKWLNVDVPDLSIVDHKDIYRDRSLLPVFNSSAIISQLHHIGGLAEHYLYINDDMFFGRDVRPEDFWHGSGIAKIFPARNRRPVVRSSVSSSPHFNISSNIRELLQSEFGVTISRAIRHTPYPQIRSVNREIEQRFSGALARTAGNKFRHHSDVALDQLFHYYAQITGHAVPSSISYDYVNVGAESSIARMRRLLASRNRSVFCLNDAPQDGEAPVPDEEVQLFLKSYFPIPSRFERRQSPRDRAFT